MTELIETERPGRLPLRPSPISTSAMPSWPAGLVKHYGDNVALAGIDLDVRAGTVTAVLGPNGAGKTTAVRILTTLTDATEGTATVAGFDVAAERRRGAPAHRPRRPGRHRRSAAHRPGEPRDARRAAPARPQGRRRPRRRAARAVLAHRRRRPRRCRATPAACAAASTSPPRSSPARRCCSSTSRPPGSTRGRAPSCGSVLDTLVDRGTTMLLTTQYLDEAERLADDIIVIDRGRVIARGDARSLKREVGGDHINVVVVDATRLDEAAAIVADGDGQRAGRSTPRLVRSTPRRPAASTPSSPWPPSCATPASPSRT